MQRYGRRAIAMLLAGCGLSALIRPTRAHGEDYVAGQSAGLRR